MQRLVLEHLAGRRQVARDAHLFVHPGQGQVVVRRLAPAVAQEAEGVAAKADRLAADGGADQHQAPHPVRVLMRQRQRDLTAHRIARQMRPRDSQSVHEAHHPIGQLFHAEGVRRPFRAAEAGHIGYINSLIQMPLFEHLHGRPPGI